MSHAHLVVENLGLARFGLGDQRLVQHIKNILADALEFGFDLGTVVPDDGDVLLRSLRLFLLLDGRDDPPGSTSSADYVLVRYGE